MKKISITIPCYNEEDNVIPLYKALIEMLNRDLEEYDYEILFIDNCSVDSTKVLIRELCRQDSKVKAIFNAKNFGQFNSPYYGMMQTTGDCTILMAADFQDPIELIPKFVQKWEVGYKIVSGIKRKSKENRIMHFIRTCYYKMIKGMSDIEQIEHFTGFGLYDKKFMDVLRNLNDPTPFLRGIVAELGFARAEVEYEQPKRRMGKTSNNFWTLYDAAMLSFTSYTKIGLRIATLLGFLGAITSFLVGFIYLIWKIVSWESFDTGITPIILIICFVSAIQLFFIGFMGEYILAMNKRIMNRPLVIEEERVNFEGKENV